MKKPERDELRKLLEEYEQLGKQFDAETDHSDATVMHSLMAAHKTVSAAAVQFVPKLLDALDEADKCIAELEKDLAEEEQENEHWLRLALIDPGANPPVAWKDRAAELERKLAEISQWANAYPATVFKEPDLEKTREVLDVAGISIDGLHGTWGRHITEGIREILANKETRQ